MKKLLTALFSALLIGVSALGFSACGNGNEGVITVYMPDGAPALAMAQLMCEDTDFGVDVEYNVVSSTEITTHVSYTDEAKNADLCVLPVNAASKLLGTGEKYQMLGTVTHGNLYLVKNGEGLANIDSTDDLTNLVGKTVGVVQLANVPGLTFKAILKNNGLEYNELGTTGEVSTDKVNLKAFADATAVTPAVTDCEYFVLPEPAVTSKTAGETSFKLAGNLQTLYGGENGYTQAVLVAKKSLIESNPSFISEFMQATADAAQWLLTEAATGTAIYDAIDAHYDKATPSFPAAVLNNKAVIENCAIYFTPSADCKQDVITFISDLIEVDATSAKAVSDAFFYIPATK